MTRPFCCMYRGWRIVWFADRRTFRATHAHLATFDATNLRRAMHEADRQLAGDARGRVGQSL